MPGQSLGLQRFSQGESQGQGAGITAADVCLTMGARQAGEGPPFPWEQLEMRPQGSSADERARLYCRLIDEVLPNDSYACDLERHIPHLMPVLLADIEAHDGPTLVPALDVLAWILSGEACGLGATRTESSICKTSIWDFHAAPPNHVTAWSHVEGALFTASSWSFAGSPHCSDAAASVLLLHGHSAALATIFFTLYENRVFRGQGWRHAGDWARLTAGCLSRPSIFPEATRLRACDLFKLILRDPLICTFLPSVVIEVNSEVSAQLISAAPLERQCYIEFIETAACAAHRGVVVRSDTVCTQTTMDALQSVLTSASPETLREAASVVGQAWRLWVATVLRGVPNRRLSDFLRDGSRGSSTAGVILRPVETMFLHSGTRLEASLCWQTLAREIVAVEDWEKDGKVIKLLLRCCIHVLETEQEQEDVVTSIIATLDLLMKQSWPRTELILDTVLRSDGYTLRKYLETLLPNMESQLDHNIPVRKCVAAASLLYLHEPPPQRTVDERIQILSRCGKNQSWMISKIIDITTLWNLMYKYKVLVSSAVLTKISGNSEPLSPSSLAQNSYALWTAYVEMVGNYLVFIEKGPNIMSQFTPAHNRSSERCDFSQGIVLSMDDSQGIGKPVLASTSAHSAATLLEIASAAWASAIWHRDNLLRSEITKCVRESVLSALMGLAHKLSAFDLMPADDRLQNRVAEIWNHLVSPDGSESDGLVTAGHGALQSSGTVGTFIVLLIIGQAYALDSLGFLQEERDSYCRAMVKCIRNSMNSILECRALPDILSWLPSTVRRMFHCNRRVLADEVSPKITASFRINIISYSNNANSALSGLEVVVGSFVSSAEQVLANMPIGDDIPCCDIESLDSTTATMKSNLVEGLLKLLTIPILLLEESICFPFLAVKEKRSRLSSNDRKENRPWKKLFTVIFDNGDQNCVSQLCNLVGDHVNCVADGGALSGIGDLLLSESIIEMLQYVLSLVELVQEPHGSRDDRTNIWSSTSSTSIMQLAAKLLSTIVLKWSLCIWRLAQQAQQTSNCGVESLDNFKTLCGSQLACDLIRAILSVDSALNAGFTICLSNPCSVGFFESDLAQIQPMSLKALLFHVVFISIPKALCSAHGAERYLRVYASFSMKIFCEISFSINTIPDCDVKYRTSLLECFEKIEHVLKDFNSGCDDAALIKSALSNLITEMRSACLTRDVEGEALNPRDLFGVANSRRGFLAFPRHSPHRFEASSPPVLGKRACDDDALVNAGSFENQRAESKRFRPVELVERLDALTEVVQGLRGAAEEKSGDFASAEWVGLIAKAELILFTLKGAGSF